VPDFRTNGQSWGAGPRAVPVPAARGKATRRARRAAPRHTDDIRAVARPVLRHRVITNFNAEAEGVTPDTVVDRLLEETPSEEGAIGPDGAFAKVLRS
jgi:MoxR-like ATPase